MAEREMFNFVESFTEDVSQFCAADGFCSEQFVVHVLKSLKHSSNEGDLQDGIFQALRMLNNNVTVLDESLKPPLATRSTFLSFIYGIVVMERKSHAEKDKKNLLFDIFAAKFPLSVAANVKMKATEPGLFAISTSIPDLAVSVDSIRKGRRRSHGTRHLLWRG
jgi:hypothetical protein